MKKEDPESLVSATFHPEANQKKKKHAVWIIHGYPPVLNAGAEGMSHCLNQFLLKHGGRKRIVRTIDPAGGQEGEVLDTTVIRSQVNPAGPQRSNIVGLHLLTSRLAAI
jgi:hypothetical protein